MRGEAEGLKFFELAAANPLLGQMPAAVLESLVTHGVLVEVGADEHLLRQGDQSDAAYLLVDGEVDVSIENSYGSVHLTRLSTGAGVHGASQERERHSPWPHQGSEICARRYSRRRIRQPELSSVGNAHAGNLHL
jgi:CRP-like cAMP-binding protein